ncbi:MAG TPA: carboxymuconolactone decarboxylase family protein [Gammaproteobacteria bacterium]|nr:carboxymuconolactone decarboxylase family protein [Gammaproteobacteria bacterium]
MNIEQLKNALPEYAKDIKLNLINVLSIDGAPDLNLNQIYGIALSSALATGNKEVITAITAQAENYLSEKELEAAKAATIIMAMNNVYYRFIHLASDKSYAAMPAKLRMNVIGNPGIDKVNFELNCLAVSAMNGCGMCMDAHAHELTKAGISKLGVQSCVRIAAVVNAATISLKI